MSSLDKLQPTRANPEGLSPAELLMTAVEHWGDSPDTLLTIIAGSLDRAYNAGLAQGIKRGVNMVVIPVQTTVDAALKNAEENQRHLTKGQPTWADVVKND